MEEVRTIGLLGGMSWESSIEYERIINTAVREALGGVHSASLLLRSYDFARIERLSPSQDLREAAASLYGAMRRLDDSGLDLITAESVPETGIGAAIMDRLRKAAAR